MNKPDQITFVKDLLDSMKTTLIKQIVEGRIPEEWDGIELRWLIADNAKENSARFHNSNKRRGRAYTNAVIVNNL